MPIPAVVDPSFSELWPDSNFWIQTESPQDLMSAVCGMDLFAAVPVDSLLFRLLDTAISTLPRETMSKMETLVRRDAFGKRNNKPTKLLRDMLMGPVGDTAVAPAGVHARPAKT